MGEVKINILAYADDIVLITSSREEMQHLLDLVWDYSRKWRFMFNVAKSKVLIFTLKRVNIDRNPLYLGLRKLEEVNCFKYLGVDFQANLCWKLMKARVLRRARSRMVLVSKAISDGVSPASSLKLWQTLILPILEYGGEVWGLLNWPDGERLQIEFGRKILGVGCSFPSAVVRGELGWWSLRGRSQLALLRWWGKVIKMDHTRLCYRVYHHRKNRIAANRNSWCSSVRSTLHELNLDEYWESEDIGHPIEWCSLVKTRIAARESANWKKAILEMPKLRTYRVLKSELELEDYLLEVSNPDFRRILTKIRGGTLRLQIEVGRWENTPAENRYCNVCAKLEVEDERHFLLDCWPYERLRMKMFSEIRARTGGVYDLAAMRYDRERLLDVLVGHNLPNKTHRSVVRNAAARFCLKAWKARCTLIANPELDSN